MAHDKEDSGFMEMVAVAALLFLFWKFFIKKQEIPEPATTPAELKDQFAKDPNFNLNDYCKDVIYRPLSSSDLTLSNLRGEGWCYRGDRSAIDESKGFGDAYADKQAENYQSMKEEEAIIVNNKESIQFRLINTTAAPITTDVLNTTTQPSVIDVFTVVGVVNFQNNAYITLPSIPDVTGSKVIKFGLYLDYSSPVRSVLFYFSGNTADNLRVSIQAGQMNITVGIAPVISKKYDISSFFGQILSVEIQKSAASVDALYINDVLQVSTGNVISATETTEAYIGRDNFLTSSINTCSLWDLEIVGSHKWAGRPNGNTSDAWADVIGAIDGTFVGSADIRNL